MKFKKTTLLIIALLLSLNCIFLFVACSNNNQGQYEENSLLEFELNSDGQTYSVKGLGNCLDSDITIPSFYNRKKVTAIKANAFKETDINSVKISSGIEEIGTSAFSNAKALIKVVLPDTLISIGDYAFCECTSLENIKLPTKLKTIGNPEGSEYISGGTFWHCSSLQSIEIPDSVTYLGPSSFKDCTSLNNFNLGTGITVINANCFQNCISLSSVTVPDNIKEIKSNAFSSCRFKTINLGKGVEKLGENVFAKCSNLEEVFASSYKWEYYKNGVWNELSLGSVSFAMQLTNVYLAGYGCKWQKVK